MHKFLYITKDLTPHTILADTQEEATTSAMEVLRQDGAEILWVSPVVEVPNAT